MKVLHVTSGIAAALGGPTTAAIQMCAALTQKGADVELVSTDLAERGSFAPLYRPVRLSQDERDTLSAQPYRSILFRASWPTRFAYARGMRAALSRKISGYDLVHIHAVYVYTSLIAAKLARNRRVPYILRPHGSFMPHLRGHSRFAKAVYHLALAREMWNGASAIHYTSDRERDEATDLGIASRSVVLPLGIDLSPFGALPAEGKFRAAWPQVGGGRLVVFLGRLTPRKGLESLIAAFGDLAHDVPDSHLVLAGPDEFGYREHLRGVIAHRGLASRVTMPGLLLGEQKLALLADTSVWVLPSRGENFGIAVVEALAAGCAVVISDKVDIARDLSNEGALAVSGTDVEELTPVIRRLLTNESERDALRRRGRVAASRFGWDARIGRVMELYQDVLTARHLSQLGQ